MRTPASKSEKGAARQGAGGPKIKTDLVRPSHVPPSDHNMITSHHQKIEIVVVVV